MITLEPPRGMDGKGSPWQSVGLSAAGLGRFLRAAQQAAGLEGEVHVLLADDATLRRLNRTFRGKDKATDVLSFPAGPTTVFFGDPEGPELAGDLAISLETAARQAEQFGHSLRDEVRVLLLHGVLHLAGFDHETDAGEMAAREAELREKLGLPAGLIARVGKGAVKSKSKQSPPRYTGILPAPASKLAGDPVRVAQNDKRKTEAGKGRKKPQRAGEGMSVAYGVDARCAAGGAGAGRLCGPRVQRDGQVPGARVSGQHRRVDAGGGAEAAAGARVDCAVGVGVAAACAGGDCADRGAAAVCPCEGKAAAGTCADLRGDRVHCFSAGAADPVLRPAAAAVAVYADAGLVDRAYTAVCWRRCST